MNFFYFCNGGKCSLEMNLKMSNEPKKKSVLFVFNDLKTFWCYSIANFIVFPFFLDNCSVWHCCHVFCCKSNL